jgi:Mycothiol maleylpyruvate isomerase N-terminal domain
VGEEIDLLVALDRAHALARSRVAQITPDDWELPTPCEDWNVGAVALHLAVIMEAYDAVLSDTWKIADVQERIFAITNTPETAGPLAR